MLNPITVVEADELVANATSGVVPTSLINFVLNTVVISLSQCQRSLNANILCSALSYTTATTSNTSPNCSVEHFN